MGEHLPCREKLMEMVRDNRLSVDEGVELLNGLYREEKKESPDIAVIGMSGQFPDAPDVNEFWKNLAAGKNSINEIPAQRPGWEIFKETNPGEMGLKSRWGAFLSDIDRFDPHFFNLSAREAHMMDPRQRLFLQETWKALECAGYSDKELEEKECGIYVGCQEGDYLKTFKGDLNPYIPTGISNSILAARMAYILNLKGPSLAIDTACSSALVAIHLACESIRQGTCRMAIAGGVLVMTSPLMFMALDQISMFSPKGQCYVFDNKADGTVIGEAVGVVILKALPAALQDRDHIYGVIKGSEINQDGKTSGITAPSASSQTLLESKVYRKYKINPETISYIETHGTGTKLGDPIEVQALTDAFQQFTAKKHVCALGSVKTNIGHSMPAAGISSFIKVLCCLKHKKLVPSLNFETENEHIHFKDSPFYVNTKFMDWETSGNQKRRAAINSFGFSGTNCHMVVEEAPDQAIPGREKGERENGILEVNRPCPCHLILISAQTRDALIRKVQDLAHWLERYGRNGRAGDRQTLENISYTLNVGRTHFPVRLAWAVTGHQDLLQKLQDTCKNSMSDSNIPGSPKSAGSQRPQRPQPEAARKELGVRLLNELQAGAVNGNALSAGEYTEKLMTLADLYVNGYELDWKLLYRGKGCYRISLPTYPFSGDRYWFTETENKKTVSLHPFIDAAKSTSTGQQFSRRLTGNEFFLTDHVINDIKIFPGVGYMEMARAAGSIANNLKIRKIINIVWTSFLSVQQPRDIHVNLRRENQMMGFEVSSSLEDNQLQVHAQGKLIPDNQHENRTLHSGTFEIIDIKSIKKRSLQVLSGNECYRLFRESGYKYGPCFQSIQQMYLFQDEALSFLQLPSQLKGGFKEFILHPTLLDGAFQTVMGVIGSIRSKTGEPEPDPQPHLPFVLGELEILNPLTEQCYVYLRRAQSQSPSTGHRGLEKFDIWILNPQGKILVSMRDFSLRALNQLERATEREPVAAEPAAIQAELSTTIFCRSDWEKSAPGAGKPNRAIQADSAAHEGLTDDINDINDINNKDHIDDNETILIFDAAPAWQEALQTRWKNEKKDSSRIFRVTAGIDFINHGNQSYEINPARQADYSQLVDSLKNQGRIPAKIIFLWAQETFTSHTEAIQGQLFKSVYPVLYISRALMELKPCPAVKLLYVFPSIKDKNSGITPGSTPNPFYAAVAGLLKTLRLENNRFVCKTVEIEIDPPERNNENMISTGHLDTLLAEFQEDEGLEIRYVNKQRFIRRLKEITAGMKATGVPVQLKEKGVYVITGGLGGLGQIFARHLAEQVQARLVLTDLSPLDAHHQTWIQTLESLGSEVLYIPADVSDPHRVKAMIASARERFNEINGIFHCAGLNKDSYIFNKTPAEIQAVLAPKVYGTINLDETTTGENLDFFLMFSSTAARLGNPGQSDYAYANHFMDHYSLQREKLRQQGKRRGSTISINWPLWREGGMHVDKESEKMAAHFTGMTPLPTAAGIAAFSNLLALGEGQISLFHGEPGKIRNILGLAQESTWPPDREVPIQPAQPQSVRPDSGNLYKKVQDDLLKIASGFIKVKGIELDLETDIQEYGFDSIALTAYSNELNDVYQLGITPALFFELDEPTIGSLAEYLYKKFRELFSRYYQEEMPQEPMPLPEISHATAATQDNLYSTPLTEAIPGDWESAEEKIPSATENVNRGSIAIIGMSGVMPQSDDLETFWKHLEQGKDLISEVPRDRWNQDSLNENQKSIRWGGFMKEVDKFDPMFFGISPREAELMDPQQRIFLETVWKTIEDASYKVSDLSGKKVGIFVGVANTDYAEVLLKNSTGIESHSSTGVARSILANRISYLLNFHGPSEPIDTACSSSLVAIHRAIEAIYSGTCEIAIAGGVNVMLSPTASLAFLAAGMLSPDGRCKTFDERADGYVRGEGSAAILLKPLNRARADGDHIYAVIRGTAENHGGRAHSLTAPNANAQAELISEAFERARIDPTTVTYIEAHGTGTNLGDPVEINGLKKAFSALLEKKGKSLPKKAYCGIGSVKTNIGHLETAAGIAGIVKVLLALKYKTLPASINFKKINPHIQMENTPFYVVNKTIPWECLTDEQNQPLPRRAGVSSFGFGGTNAHILLEEYDNNRSQLLQQPPSPQYPMIIVLSTRHQERLKPYARKLADFLENTRQFNYSLTDIAYSLQTGREEMEERLALVVSGVSELRKALIKFCQGTITDEKIYQGSTGQTKSGHLIDGEEGEEYIHRIIQKRNLDKIAHLWVSGVKIQWKLLYDGAVPQRIALPTYPFTRERYWVPESGKSAGQPGSRPLAGMGLHALIDSNESTYAGLCWKKTFTGSEFFLEDHGNILPAVVYMEMVRAAGDLAHRNLEVKKLRNLVWANPILVTANPKEVYISLYKSKQTDWGEFRCETLETRGENRQRITHSRGMLQYSNHITPAQKPEYIDITAILKRCRDNRGKANAEEYYNRISRNGGSLGPRFRGIQEFYFNQHEAVSRLGMNQEQEKSRHQYILHPTLTDAGIQSAVAFGYRLGLTGNLIYLPYVLGELEIVDSQSTPYYAYITPAAEPGKPQEIKAKTGNAGKVKFNILLLDEQGRVLIKMKGLSLRPINPGLETPVQGQESVKTDGVVYFQSTWKEAQLENPEQSMAEHPAINDNILVFDTGSVLNRALEKQFSPKPGTSTTADGKNRVILVKPGEKFKEQGSNLYEMNPADESDYTRLAASLEKRGWIPGTLIHSWSRDTFCSDEGRLNSQLDLSLYSLFHITRAFATQQHPESIRVLYFYFSQAGEIQPQYAAISAFARSIAHETGKFIYKIIEVLPPGESADTEVHAQLEEIVISELLTETRDFNVLQIRRQDGQRWCRCLEEFNLESEAAAIQTNRDHHDHSLPCKENGTYLITGGGGSLGLLVAEYISRQIKTNLVLTDCLPLSPEKETRIKEIEARGTPVTFIPADLAKRNDVRNLINETRSRCKRINGIIHCAGTVQDARFTNKTRAGMNQVLAPKVFATLYLDEETRNEKLDFFILFSSMIAVTGNSGQCDYAYGNAFMDEFSKWRNHLHSSGQRQGITLAINWPLWKEGGMRPGKAIEDLLFKIRGVKTLNTETGLKAFTLGLSTLGSRDAFMVLEGDREKIRLSFQSHDPSFHQTSGQDFTPGIEIRSPATAETVTANQEVLQDFKRDLLKIVADLLKIPEHKIHLEKNMSQYGFDSISFTDFAEKVNKTFNLRITPDLFFEHPTIGSIASFLLERYHTIIRSYYSPDIAMSSPVQEWRDSRQWDFEEPAGETGAGQLFDLQENIDIPIAVIGMSGVMPQSEDLDIFWKNLEEEKNLVTEIPANRWNWQDYTGLLSDPPEHTSIRWGSFLNEVDRFDPLFFNISPMEAELMDPQQRIFMETVWATIEDAGYKASALSGTSTGIFIGVTTLDYSKLLAANNKRDLSQFHFLFPNRISYFLNLHGPSESIDTACSSSLVAIHRAVESIRNRECEMAIAGGVNVILDPLLMVSMGSSGMLSPSGKSYTFDKRADGFVRGEGSGAIFLKPLSKAEADNDHIYAVIRGSGVNHSGHTNSPTTPNPIAQAELLTGVYEKAGIDPATVSYIETHGTGTRLGDPIEINGLKRAFENLYKKWNKPVPLQPHCGLGAVKTNIGHLEAAAGIAGVIKVILALKHKTIPANINFQELNPYIHLQDSPFYIVKETMPWPSIFDEQGRKIPALAGVSSFGIGGTNAHVILEEGPKNSLPAEHPPGSRPGNKERNTHLIILSARDETRLYDYVQRMADFLNSNINSLSGPTPVKESITPPADEKTVMEKIEEDLITIAAGCLNTAGGDITSDENLNEYGFEPISLAEFLRRVQQTFNIDISVAANQLVYDNNLTIRYLAAYLYDTYKDHFSGFYHRETHIHSSEGIVPGGSDFYHQPGINLGDMAYTLQMGREAMDERLAVVVDRAKELQEKLKQFIQARNRAVPIENLYRGKVNKNRTEPGRTMKQNDHNAEINALIYQQQWHRLAQLWTSGIDIDWKLLYREHPVKLRRISLPTYPFARKRCWFAQSWPGEKSGAPLLSQESVVTTSTTKHTRTPGEALNSEKLLENIKSDTASLISGLLKIEEEELDFNHTLLDYGFTSITMTAFIQQLNKRYDIEMTAESFFDLQHPSIDSLARYLYKKFENAFSQYYRESIVNRHVVSPPAPAGEVIQMRQEIQGPDLEPVAIIGLSGRMPRADNLETFWELIINGNNIITEIPENRYISAKHFINLTQTKVSNSVKSGSASNGKTIWGSFLNDVESFDTMFFGISQEEADIMNPQQRIMLETVWKAFEDAGYKVSDLAGAKTGLFIGVSFSGYDEMPGAADVGIDSRSRLKNIPSLLANRLSHLLNLDGPGESIDTTGSGSLLPILRAVEALRTGKCRTALAGGVNVILNPMSMWWTALEKAGIFSGDGHCNVFDRDAHGVVRGEGAGVILLKLLSQAEADNDHIYAIIRGSAEKRSGYTGSFVNDNIPAQVELLIDAYVKTGIDPGTISYIEANGSAVPQGDLAEISALKTAYAELHKRTDKSCGLNPPLPYCGIGSLTSHIGHLEGASGTAGVINVLLAMKYKKLPAVLHLNQMDPRLQLEGSPFYIVDKVKSWDCVTDPKGQVIPRRAGVSSFGFAGVNTHIILEEYVNPISPADIANQVPYIIVLSAKNRERLKVYASDMADFLKKTAASYSSSHSGKEEIKNKGDRQRFSRAIEDEILPIATEMLTATDNGYEPSSVDRFIHHLIQQFDLQLTPGIFLETPSIGTFIKKLVQDHKDHLFRCWQRRETGSMDRDGSVPVLNLTDLAYTLQLGREELEERLAIIVASVNELIGKLIAYCQDKQEINGLYQGRVKERQGEAIHLIEGEEGEAFTRILFKNKKPEKLARFWVLGGKIDWTLLYTDSPRVPQRISLPTYPFARTGCGVSSIEKPQENQSQEQAKHISET